MISSYLHLHKCLDCLLRNRQKKSKIIRLLASERNLVDLVCGGNADAVIIFIGQLIPLCKSVNTNPDTE